jgi:hypothetical protein
VVTPAFWVLIQSITSIDDKILESEVLQLESFSKHYVTDISLANDLVPVAITTLPQDEWCSCSLDDGHNVADF